MKTIKKAPPIGGAFLVIYLKIVFLDILEVLVSAMLDFLSGRLVTDDDAVGMELQGADGPPLCDGALDGSLQSAGLVVSIAEDEDLTGIHDSADTYGKGRSRNILGLTTEESAVGDTGVGRQRLLACTAVQTAARLIESNVSVGTDTTDKQVDTAGLNNHLFIMCTLCCQILGIAVEDVDVLFWNVNVVEEVGGHEAMIALGMALGQVHVLVHIKRQHVLEAHTTGFVGSGEGFIHTDGTTTGGQAEYERLLSCRLGSVDLVNYIVGGPLGHPIIIRFNDYSHRC